MYSIVYICLSVIAIVWALFSICHIRLKKRKRADRELLRLTAKINMNINILFSVIFLILFIVMIYLLYDALSKSHILFKDKYIDSFFQIFDDAYINDLREYFVNNVMVGHLLITVQYLIDIPKLVFYISFMISLSIYHFYIGFKQNIIYEDGIFINSTLYKWDDIKGFEWGELRERKGKAYYSLTVNLTRQYDLNRDKKLRINAESRNKIDEIFAANIIKSGV